MSECDSDPFVLKGRATVLTEAEWTTMLVTFIVVVSWVTFHLAVFLALKGNYARTKLRVAVYSVIYYMGIMSFTVGFVLPYVVGWDRYPCWLTYFLTCSCLAFFNATNFTRGTTFMLMTKLSYATFRHGRISIDITNEAEEKLAALGWFRRLREEFSWIRFGFGFLYRADLVQKTDDKDEHLKTLLALKFITSIRGSLMFASFIMLPWFLLLIIVCISVPTYRNNCYGCAPDHDPLVYTIISLGAFVVGFAAVFAAHCRGLTDVWGVFRESRLSAVGVVTSSIGFMIMCLGTFQGRYFFVIVAAMSWSIGFSLTTSFQVFLGSRQRGSQVRGTKITSSPGSKRGRGANAKTGNKASQAESSVHDSILASFVGSPCADLKGCSKLNEILADNEIRRTFEFHLSEEFGLENLSFLLDTQEWRMSFHDVSRSAALSRARKIFSTYVSNDGLYQINIAGHMSKELSNALAAGEDRLTATIFDKARTEIARLLEVGAVSRFITTPAYVSATSAKAVMSAVA